MRSFVLLPLTLHFCVITLFAQINAEGKAVLEKLYTVYGGQTKIAAFSAMVQSGTTFSASRGNSAGLTRTYAYPSQLKIVKSLPDIAPQTRLLADGQAWQNGKSVEGMLRDSMRLQAARMMLPKLLLDNEERLEYKGKLQSEDAQSWHIFHLPLPSKGLLIVQIDPQSYRIRSTRAMMPLDEWRTMEFLTAYEAFKQFDGYLFATKEYHYAKDIYLGWSEITSVSFLKALSKEAFAP